MQENKEIPRILYPIRLGQTFSQDYQDMLKHYPLNERIELTEHLIKVFEIMQEHLFSDPKLAQKKYADLEYDLMKKYRSKLKSFSQKQFQTYFHYDTALHEHNIIDGELWNTMVASEQQLSEEEMNQFISNSLKSLNNSKYFLLLEEETPQVKELSNFAPTEDEKDLDATKARQLLTIYYFLKATVGIEHRESNSTSAIAKFIHLMTGTKFSNIQNSDIYKKYQRMPNYNNGGQLIKDLKFIRPYFEELGLESAVKMIEVEIKRTMRELPLIERKKLMDDI